MVYYLMVFILNLIVDLIKSNKIDKEIFLNSVSTLKDSQH